LLLGVTALIINYLRYQAKLKQLKWHKHKKLQKINLKKQ
jgi:hypothetical protein